MMSLEASRGRNNRLPAVDGLRAIAILLVVLFHYKNRWVPGGYVGVDLFFVISGFVITRSLTSELEANGRVSLRGFYLRRARRILPAMVVAVFGIAGLSAATGRLSTADLHAAAAVVTSSYNWFLAYDVFYGTDFVHLWSLAIEEQFYLLWPITFALLAGAKARSLRALVIVAIAASMLWSTYLAVAGPSWHRAYFGADTRAQGILMGCLLALAGTQSVPSAIRRVWPIPAVALIVMALTLDNHAPGAALWGFALAAVASAWLIVAAVEDPAALAARALSAPPLQWLGLRSYSLFLWHFPIAQALHALDVRYWPSAGFLLSLILADLSYRLVERPFLREGRGGPGTFEAQAAP